MRTELGMDWAAATAELNEKGFTSVSRVLSSGICYKFIADYDDPRLYRKTVLMERNRCGRGEYKYFDDPLPEFIQTVRETFYPKLAPIANDWMKKVGIDTCFPGQFSGLQELCRAHGQTQPTPLILKYGKGGYNTLHKDLY